MIISAACLTLTPRIVLVTTEVFFFFRIINRIQPIYTMAMDCGPWGFPQIASLTPVPPLCYIFTWETLPPPHTTFPLSTPVPLTSPSHRLPTGNAAGVLCFVMSSHHIRTADHPSSQSHTVHPLSLWPLTFFFACPTQDATALWSGSGGLV